MKKLDIPCKCGFEYPGFHVCAIDMSTPKGRKHATTPVAIVKAINTAKERAEEEAAEQPKERKTRVMSEETREKIRQAQQARRQRERATPQRNTLTNRVINRYREGGISVADLAVEMGVSKTKTLSILQKARDNGLLEIRMAGLNIRHTPEGSS